MNDFPTPIPSLRLISEQILRPNWHHVKDVGDCPYEVIANLLKLSTAAQLATIEGSTPHLTKSTDHIWKDLCVKDFVEVRKLVEDSKIEVSQSIDGSWKAKYFEEEEKKQIKMSQVLERLRGQYHDLDEKKQSRQTQSIDGLRLEKRRKLTSGGGHWGNTRPKSLLEKARSNTKQITSIYAPKRKPVQQPSARKVPSVSTAFPSSRKPPAGQSHLPTPGSSRSPPPLALPQSSEKVIRPVIKTVTRTTTTKRSSALTSTLPSATSPRALPSGSHSRQNSFSPPPSAASASLPPPSRPRTGDTPLKHGRKISDSAP
ncbi:hypothetical protein JCM5353_003662 [Sporobolomyces roseus]